MKAGHNTEQHNYIRNKLQELGRLLEQLRKGTGNNNSGLMDFIDPQKLTIIIDAVHAIAGFNESSHCFQILSLALKLGHSINSCATLASGLALQRGDRDEADHAQNFATLCAINDWQTYVSSHAHRTLYQSKRNNPEELPLNEDIVEFSKYLQDTSDKQMEILISGEKTAWNLLAETVLCQVIMFNRRRQGEVYQR